MGTYFDDIHSMPENELGGLPHGLADSPEVIALRGMDNYAGLMALGKALCRQLRYREAIEVYTRAIACNPAEPEAYRQRAARYLATLQPELAVEDFQRSLPFSFDKADTLYRMGIALYLAGRWEEAMEAQEKAYPCFDEEMGIAAMFWHTMSAFRSGREPVLLREFREGMEVGHHTAYELAMQLASGRISLEQTRQELQKIDADLEYAMAAYGSAVCAERMGETEIAAQLLDSVVRRDSFWICYGYLAAWNDRYNR